MEDSSVTQQQPAEDNTLEERLMSTRSQWTYVIDELNEKMKDAAGLQSLMNIVYSKRQECVEYLSNLQVVYGRLVQRHKQYYATKYRYYKTQYQFKFNSDASLSTQIESDLDDINTKIILIGTHVDAMRETLKTIDNLIYGITHRIKLYEMVNGLKF